uniref:2-amino-4-hydroxy-6- hydroxymethyldihydropteridine diphosphokinase n=1 Tax=Staphylococcus epidermidis TaxID=1282 RepID=UPI0021B1BF4F
YEGIEVSEVCDIYESEGVGYSNEGKLLKLWIEIESELNGECLLKCCLRREQEVDGKREIGWGGRSLDIDIVVFGDEIIEEDNL